MFALASYSEAPFAYAFLDESIAASPAPPYTFTAGVLIGTITVTCDDPDGGVTTMRQVSGSLPPGLALSRALPSTAAVPFTSTITGTPTAPGAYSVTYENDDGSGGTSQIAMAFTILPGAPPPVVGSGPSPVIGNRSPLVRFGGGGRRMK